MKYESMPNVHKQDLTPSGRVVVLHDVCMPTYTLSNDQPGWQSSVRQKTSLTHFYYHTKLANFIFIHLAKYEKKIYISSTNIKCIIKTSTLYLILYAYTYYDWSSSSLRGGMQQLLNITTTTTTCITCCNIQQCNQYHLHHHRHRHRHHYRHQEIIVTASVK